MELDWLDDFCALASAQNFSRAATSRNITQPAFSRRVRLLENWVGVPLFDRQPRRVLLTPAGERFRSIAERIPRELREAKIDAEIESRRRDGVLTIAATHALSFTFFPTWARKTVASSTATSLVLLSDSMTACEKMMRSGDVQLLICHHHIADESKLAEPAFRHHRIGSDRLVPCVAPDENGAPLWSLDEATSNEAVPFLSYEAQSGLGRILAADWRAREIRLPLRPVVSARVATALMSLAEAGQGVAWLPESVVDEKLQTGELMLASSNSKLTTPLDIVLYRASRRLPAAAEAVWSAILLPDPTGLKTGGEAL